MSQRILPITDIDITHKYLEVDKKDLSAKPQDARRAICVQDRGDWPTRYGDFNFGITKKFTNSLLRIFR